MNKSVETINSILYSIDPMNTHCNINEDMESEYSIEATTIFDKLKQGNGIKETVFDVFTEYFGAGYVKKKITQLEQVTNEITKKFPDFSK